MSYSNFLENHLISTEYFYNWVDILEANDNHSDTGDCVQNDYLQIINLSGILSIY